MTIQIKYRGEWNEYYCHLETGISFDLEEDIEGEIAYTRDLLTAAGEWLAFLEDRAQTQEAKKIAESYGVTGLSDEEARRVVDLSQWQKDAWAVPGPIIEALEQNPRVWQHILGRD